MSVPERKQKEALTIGGKKTLAEAAMEALKAREGAGGRKAMSYERACAVMARTALIAEEAGGRLPVKPIGSLTGYEGEPTFGEVVEAAGVIEAHRGGGGRHERA